MKHIFKRFKFYDYLTLMLIFGLILCQTYFEMELISCGGELIGRVRTLADSSEIWETGWKIIGMACIIFFAILFVSLLSTYLSSKIARDLRRDVFAKVNEFSANEINKFSTSSLITRSTNDVTQIQRTLMMSMRMMFTAPCMAFFALRKITLLILLLLGYR